MKNIRWYVFVCFLLIRFQIAAQDVDFGIVGVLDKETQLNYNHLFLKVLKENKVDYKRKPATINLIEHSSNADRSIKVDLNQNSMSISYFIAGNIVLSKEVYVPQISVTENTAIPFELSKVSNGLKLNKINSESFSSDKPLIAGSYIIAIGGKSTQKIPLNQISSLFSFYNDTLMTLICLVKYGIESVHKVKFFSNKKTYWPRPLSPTSLGFIFQEIAKDINSKIDELRLSINGNKILTVGTTKKLNVNYAGGTFRSDEVLTNKSNLNKFYNYPELKTIFPEFAFTPIKLPKNPIVGDVSLILFNYYNQDKVVTYLGKNKSIKENFKNTIEANYTPRYYLPPVFLGYYFAAIEYKNTSNYQAALNQLYHALLLTDRLIANKSSILRAKWYILNEISSLSTKLHQDNYAEYINTVKFSIAKVLSTKTMLDYEKNAQEKSQETIDMCSKIEDQLSKLRSEKRSAILNAVNSGMTSIASFDYDFVLSLQYASAAFQVIDNYNDIKNAFNNELSKINSEYSDNKTNDGSSFKKIGVTILSDLASMGFKSQVFAAISENVELNSVLFTKRENSESLENAQLNDEFIKKIAFYEVSMYNLEKVKRVNVAVENQILTDDSKSVTSKNISESSANNSTQKHQNTSEIRNHNEGLVSNPAELKEENNKKSSQIKKDKTATAEIRNIEKQELKSQEMTKSELAKLERDKQKSERIARSEELKEKRYQANEEAKLKKEEQRQKALAKAEEIKEKKQKSQEETRLRKEEQKALAMEKANEKKGLRAKKQGRDEAENNQIDKKFDTNRVYTTDSGHEGGEDSKPDLNTQNDELKKIDSETQRIEADKRRIEAETKRIEAETKKLEAETKKLEAETKKLDLARQQLLEDKNKKSGSNSEFAPESKIAEKPVNALDKPNMNKIPTSHKSIKPKLNKSKK